MLTILELILFFAVSFAFNLIPFAGPSNMIIAGGFAFNSGNADFTTVLIIGIIVALGATLAKGIHYGITFFISGHINEKRRATLESNAAKIKKRAFLLLYLAAATPIPDEPIVFTLGLMKYNITKFFTAFFLGKLSIAIMGAFAGGKMGNIASEWLSPEMMTILSVTLTVALTIIITVILLKFDLGRLTKYFTRKKPNSNVYGEKLGKIN
ncbi:MAG: VTT domain-containing protein [Candidatus Bathyarchaeota archaeon]|nr:VTT domain-containing protein [Candidatus Termiticorpusculum sp.]